MRSSPSSSSRIKVLLLLFQQENFFFLFKRRMFVPSSSGEVKVLLLLEEEKLSSDPRMWMGGGIPTRWRRLRRDGREDRDGRVTFQIACSLLSNLAKKLSFLDTFYTLITVGKVLRPFLRPPFYTLITVGEGLLRSEHDALGGRG